MDVVGRLDALRRRLLGARDRRLVDRVAVEHGLNLGEPQRPVGDAAITKTSAPDAFSLTIWESMVGSWTS